MNFLSLPWLVGAALALLLSAIGIQTLRLNHAKDDLTTLRAADKAQVDAAKTQAVKAAAISKDAAAQDKDVQTKIEVRTKTLIKRIPAHVPPTDAHFYVWPVWGLRAYDASLGLSDPPSGFDDSPSQVGANDAARIYVANNGACVADQARLSALQAWVVAQQAAH